MKLPLFFRQSLAAKLVAAFIITAVPPMLAASHVASTMVSDSANQGIVNWLHETTNYLFTTIRDTEAELIAVQTLLRPRLVRDDTAFSAGETEALANLDIDVITLEDGRGRVLFSNAPSWSLQDEPLYPGSRFHWLNGPGGAKALAVAARAEFTAQNGEARVLELASRFDIRLSDSGGSQPLELRIFLPAGDAPGNAPGGPAPAEGGHAGSGGSGGQDAAKRAPAVNGFYQAYSSAGQAEYVLPAEAVGAMRAGADEYSIVDGNWTEDTANIYLLLKPVRNGDGGIKAVFAVAAVMFPREAGVPDYGLLFVSFFACGTLISGCGGYVLARRLTRPVRRLNDGVRAIAAGDFSCRVDARGEDEVAELSGAFNLMAGRLDLMQREAVRTARHERSRMLGEIALGFAHEIRNPLLVIKTSAELVHKSLPSGGKETRLMGFVIEEVGRIDSLLTEFLSFAKPTPLKLDYFRLDALARNVLELSAAEFAARNIKSSFSDETDGQARVLGDEKSIRQVLLNLVLNAMDAMPDGGRLDLRLYRDPDRPAALCLEVRDTGHGIEPDLLPSIHLPFFSTKKSGLGLGLPRAYAIIEEHGGAIRCESTPGQGTRFVISLNE